MRRAWAADVERRPSALERWVSQNTRDLTDAMSKDTPKAGIIILNLALYIVYTFGLKPKLVRFISMQ